MVPNTCAAESCANTTHAKGLCKRHYQQQWRTGQAAIVRPNPHGTPVQRFHRHFTFTSRDECWNWTGRKDKDGYGTLRVGETLVRAHRFSFQLTYGYLPKVVRHRCNNPSCVNPRHLLPGTHQDNMDDRRAAGNYTTDTCRRGHPWSPENTVWQGSGRGRRTCKTCRRMTPAERAAWTRRTSDA